MKHRFILVATAAAFTAFAPVSSQAQVAVDTPVGGVRVGDPPCHEDCVIIEERERPVVEMREREVRGGANCSSKTIHAEGPGGSETRTKTRCD
jgi:hypothetical protein